MFKLGRRGKDMASWRFAILATLIGGATHVFAAEPLPADAPGAKEAAAQLDSLPPVPPAPPAISTIPGAKRRAGHRFYSHKFANRKMADGQRMNPNSDIAASKNLPLGSVAKVTNLENGKSATVKIEDRGPYVNGRVVDLAPKVANDLDLKQKGVAPVEVKPITLPQPDGQVKLGAGAAEARPQEVQHAVEVTKELTGSKTSETAGKNDLQHSASDRV